MAQPSTESVPNTAKQRDALLESERNAAKEQPKSFQDEAITDKVVEIDPLGKPESPPIKGIDTKK